MAFKKKVTFTEPKYCQVCRKKVSKGKSLSGYEEYLPFVCDDCCKTYFNEVSSLESGNPRVEFRPADIRKNEYRVPCMSLYLIIRDTIIWLLIGLFSLLSTWFISHSLDGGLHSPEMRTVSVLFSAFSFVGVVNALRYLLSGLFRGMDSKRRIFLAVQAVTFLVAGILVMKCIII